MKLRTAYFCSKCDEEIDLEELHKLGHCPWCGYSTRWATTTVYEWKVVAQGGTPIEKT